MDILKLVNYPRVMDVSFARVNGHMATHKCG